MSDKDHFDARIRNLKLEIACSIIAIFPFSLLFSVLDVKEPMILVECLSLLRLAKYLPVHKLFNRLKSKSLQKWRVIEVVVTYY